MFGASDPNEELKSKIELVDVFGQLVPAVTPAGRAAVEAALKNWQLTRELSQPGIAFAQAARGSGPSLYGWLSNQAASGRGLLLRGNPFTIAPGAELYAYATRYYDLAFSGPAQPFVLTPPDGGWRHSGLPDPKDPVGTTSLAQISLPLLAAGIIGVAVLALVVGASARKGT